MGVLKLALLGTRLPPLLSSPPFFCCSPRTHLPICPSAHRRSSVHLFTASSSFKRAPALSDSDTARAPLPLLSLCHSLVERLRLATRCCTLREFGFGFGFERVI